MAQTQKSGKGGKRKLGRWKRKPSNLRYAAMNKHDEHKRKRIRQSSGEEEVKRWEQQRYNKGVK